MILRAEEVMFIDVHIHFQYIAFDLMCLWFSSQLLRLPFGALQTCFVKVF